MNLRDVSKKSDGYGNNIIIKKRRLRVVRQRRLHTFVTALNRGV